MFLSSTAEHWYNFSVIVSEEEEHIQADISVLRPDSTLENIAQLRLLYTIAQIPPLRLIFMIVQIQALRILIKIAQIAFYDCSDSTLVL